MASCCQRACSQPCSGSARKHLQGRPHRDTSLGTRTPGLEQSACWPHLLQNMRGRPRGEEWGLSLSPGQEGSDDVILLFNAAGYCSVLLVNQTKPSFLWQCLSHLPSDGLTVPLGLLAWALGLGRFWSKWGTDCLVSRFGYEAAWSWLGWLHPSCLMAEATVELISELISMTLQGKGHLMGGVFLGDQVWLTNLIP